jgi:hypothetical protein
LYWHFGKHNRKANRFGALICATPPLGRIGKDNWFGLRQAEEKDACRAQSMEVPQKAIYSFLVLALNASLLISVTSEFWSVTSEPVLASFNLTAPPFSLLISSV